MLLISELGDLTRGLAQPLEQRAPAPTRRDVVRKVDEERRAGPQRLEHEDGDVEPDRRSARRLELEIETGCTAGTNHSFAVLGVEQLAERPARVRQRRE